MRFNISEEAFLKIGLLQCHHTNVRINRTCYKTNYDRFKDAFYACPKTVNDIFHDIQNEDLVGDKRIKDPRPTHLLLALRLVTQYPTAHTLSGFGNCTEKTALTRCWKYIEAIQALKEKKIVWIFDDVDKYKELYVASVDGVHFRIWEPRKLPSTKWYSKKYNKAGLTYEIAVALYHNRIVWVNGPFPAGENDKKIFDKEGGLKSKLKEGQICIGDQGYVGSPNEVSTRNSLNSERVKDLKNRAKARQETVNARLKNFGVLAHPFRTKGSKRMARHKAVLEACLVIVQYELDNGSPLFTL